MVRYPPLGKCSRPKAMVVQICCVAPAERQAPLPVYYGCDRHKSQFWTWATVSPGIHPPVAGLQQQLLLLPVPALHQVQRWLPVQRRPLAAALKQTLALPLPALSA